MRKNIAVLIFLCVAFSSKAQEKSDTLWNGKWDPKDPNCPCYAIQKQAEKEYKELQQQKEDSLLKLHNSEKNQMNERMRKNKKRRKKNECPQTSL